MRTTLFASILFALTACPNPDAPAVDGDAGSTADSGVEPMLDGGNDEDAGPTDAGTPFDSGPVNPCPEDAEVNLAGASIQWTWWRGDPAPSNLLHLSVSDTKCERLFVSSSAEWLRATTDVGLTNLILELNPDAVRSGLHVATVSLRTDPDRAVAESIEVHLSALTTVEDGRPHVLVIGMDGVRADALKLAVTPTIDQLAERGTSSYTASTQLTAATVSAAGWHSIFTGAEPAKHGVTTNGYYLRLDRDYPTFFQRAANALNLNTAAAVHWTPLLDEHIEDSALHFDARGSDQEVTDAMAEHLRSGESQVHFVHLDDVDHAGHASGFDPYNPAYMRAIRGNDVMVRELIDAVMDRPQIAEENWLFMWVTDHGGSGRSHGGRTTPHRRIAQITAGPTAIRRLVEGGNHMDVHPTVMQHLGLSPQEAWNLDGEIFGIPLMREANCVDEFDDDQDGLVDCDDDDCAEAEACLPIARVCPGDDIGRRLEWQVYTASLQGAIARMGGSCGGLEGRERTVTWRASRTSRYAFNTISSRGNTVLWVRDGCEGEELACNDEIYGDARNDVPYNIQSRVLLDLQAEQSVVVGLDEAERGVVDQVVLNVYDLGLACEEAPTSNVVRGGVASGNNDPYPSRFEVSCAGMGRDTVVRWTAPATRTYRFDTDSSRVDTVLALFSDDCMNEIACDDDGGRGLTSSIERRVEEGDTLAVVVGGFRGRLGAWTLNITALEDP